MEHGNKRSEREDKKKKKTDVKGTHLATFPLHSCRQNFCQQICFHGNAAVVEMGYEYEL